ncbi:MAG: hypothetical protein QME90_16860 [Thermodesulfobacteriota bacterium]|nr:hypothetical protein [Thermodesulfobacteriota bacterium]
MAMTTGAPRILRAAMRSRMEAGRGNPPDLVIVCGGSIPAYRQALECVDRGGKVLCFGLLQQGVDNKKFSEAYSPFKRRIVSISYFFGKNRGRRMNKIFPSVAYFPAHAIHFLSVVGLVDVAEYMAKKIIEVVIGMNRL